MKSVFEWKTEQLKYDIVIHRCVFLGMRVGRITAVERQRAFRCECYVEFVAPFKSYDLNKAKAFIEAETIRWFEAAVTACGDKPYRAEDHPDLFNAPQASGGQAPSAPKPPAAG